MLNVLNRDGGGGPPNIYTESIDNNSVPPQGTPDDTPTTPHRTTPCHVSQDYTATHQAAPRNTT